MRVKKKKKNETLTFASRHMKFSVVVGAHLRTFAALKAIRYRPLMVVPPEIVTCLVVGAKRMRRKPFEGVQQSWLCRLNGHCFLFGSGRICSCKGHWEKSAVPKACVAL